MDWFQNEKSDRFKVRRQILQHFDAFLTLLLAAHTVLQHDFERRHRKLQGAQRFIQEEPESWEYNIC